MMIRQLTPIAALVLCLGATARGDDAALFNRLPQGANAVVLLDVQAAMASPIAVKEGWGKNQSDPPVFISAAAKRILYASQVELTTMEPQWGVALMEMNKPLSMPAIVLAESGYEDKVGGKAAVRSDRDAYFIHMENQMLGVASPANRQFATRWAAAPAGETLSPYLLAAVSGTKSTVTMALDLTNASNPTGVRRTLTADPSLLVLLKDADLKTVCETIGGIKGITVNVDIGGDIIGRATLEFSGPAAPLAPFGQQLLVAFLSSNGMELGELKDWKMIAEGPKLVTAGKLTPAGLRRLISMIQPPTPEAATDQPASGGTPAAAANPKAEASRKYFKSVSDIIDRYGPTPTLGDSASWLKRDAQRINQLSLVNVDPDLAKWGSEVASNLVQAAAVAAVGQLQVSSRAASVAMPTGSSSYDADSRSRANAEYQNALNQRRQVALEAKATASQSASKYLVSSFESRAKIRPEMVARYNVDF